MNKTTIYLTALIVLFFTGCSKNHEETVKTLIKGYLDSTLNDPKSYEPMKFDKIDTVFTAWQYSDKEGTEYFKKFESKKEEQKVLGDKASETLTGAVYSEAKYNTAKAALEKADDEVLEMAKYIDSKNEKYKGSVAYYKVKHQFRAKNGFGALTIDDAVFSIDSTFTKVIGYHQLKK